MGAWGVGARAPRSAALTEAEVQEEVAFDQQMRDLMKEGTMEGRARASTVERNMEQRLGGNVLSYAKNASVAKSSERLARSDPAAGPGVKLTLLRRGANDRPEARALIVPTSDFTERIAESRRSHDEEVAALKAQTVAISRASETAAPVARRGRR